MTLADEAEKARPVTLMQPFTTNLAATFCMDHDSAFAFAGAAYVTTPKFFGVVTRAQGHSAQAPFAEG